MKTCACSSLSHTAPTAKETSRMLVCTKHPPRAHAQLEVDNNDGGKVDGSPNLVEVVSNSIHVRSDHGIHGHKVAH